MSRKAPQEAPEPLEPTAGLPVGAAAVWREVVEANDLAGNADRTALEAYCTLVARLREARKRVEDEGMVVKDPRGRVIPHPALAVERQTAEQVRAWGDRFAPLVKPARKRGYMADATAASIAAAPHLAEAKYAGPVAAVKTLAWMIDEAQRDGMEALQKAMTTHVPNYLKACAELQITPASVPAAVPGKSEPKKGGSNVSDFQERAR
ncbi:terminase small subunit, partial [Sinomonas soli]